MSWKFVVGDGVAHVQEISKDTVAVELVYCSPAGLQICHNVSAVSAIILA